MIHHGSKLRSKIKSKGYDLVGLAKALKITPAGIQKDLNNENISRRALVKYVPVILTSVDEFLVEANESITKVEDAQLEEQPMKEDYKDLLIESLQDTVREQRKYIETLTNVVRFFPKAVQQGSVTA